MLSRSLIRVFALLISILSFNAGAVEWPYLYEIRKGDKVSWAFGTMHVQVDISEVAQFVKPKMRRARVAFAEWVIERSELPVFQRDYVEWLATSKLVEFRGRQLSPELVQRLQTEFGLPRSLAEKLTTEDCDRLWGIRSYRSNPTKLDAQLTEFAYSIGLEMRPLDSWALLERADEADRKAGHSLECDMSQTLDLIGRHAYFPGDNVDRYRLGTLDLNWLRIPGDGTALRNETWMESLKPELEKGGVFVFVGAGHFGGPSGLVDLIRAEGFSVRRLPWDDFKDRRP